MIQLTPDLRLLWAPSTIYRQICAGPRTTRWAVVARVLLAPAIAGVATGLSATGRVSWSLLASGVICWSVLAAVQLATAVALIGREGRSIGYARAFELFFLGHAAWSLWLILASAYLFAAPLPHERLLLVTAIVPAGWTAVVLFSYCRVVLGLSARRAARRTAAHQGLTLLVIATYVGWAIQLWPRVLALTHQ